MLTTLPIKAILNQPYDADADAYFRRALVLQSQARLDFTRFILGTKSLQRWSSIISGKSLRISQNIGTGSAVPDFKNSAYDGTLINGPAWGENGIVFTAASSQYLRHSRTSVFLSTQWEIFIVVNHATVAIGEQTYYAEAVASDVGAADEQGTNITASSSSNVVTSGVPSDAASYGSPPTAGITYSRFIRGTAAGTGNTHYSRPSIAAVTNNTISAMLAPTANAAIGAGRVRFLNGTVSACIIFNSQFVDDSQRDAFSFLYNSSIGRGL